MLREALRAKIPLIVCTTTDVLNAPKVLAHLAGVGAFSTKGNSGYGGKWLYDIGPQVNYASLREQCEDKERVMVIINPDESVPEAFNAGEIPVPTSMQAGVVKRANVAPANRDGVRREVQGLTLKETGEVLQLAAGAGAITPKSVREWRNQIVEGVPGVQHVSTAMPYYKPDDQITDYIQSIGRFLAHDIDPRLRPRGVLLGGIPGTGKTVGAKHIADALDAPLLRLDVGALMSKYVGESERNFRAAINAIEVHAPVVMLIDEVEKLFTGSDESGVTQNLLAALLWWLQEHTEQVLTVMTTNDIKRLPPELYRSGRIDKVLTMPEFVASPLIFYREVVQSFGFVPTDIGHPHLPEDLPVDSWTPAQITAYAIERVRQVIAEEG